MKMNSVLTYLPFISLLCVDYTLAANDSFQKILAFTSEVWHIPTSSWKSITAIPKGSQTRLTCTTSATSPSTFQLRNSNEEHSLPVEYAKYQLIHQFGNIDCHQMGTYVCEHGLDANRTIDIGVFDCEPSLCDGEDNNMTIYASVNEAKKVSVCVMAYPDLNSIELQAKPQPASLNWIIQRRRKSFNTFTVDLAVQDVTQDDFGRHTFSIFTSYKGRRKHLEYIVYLKLERPPDCPTDVKISSNAADSVALSWQPGSDGGLKQLFQVFYSINNETWNTYRDVTQDGALTLTDLQENILAFRVVSFNKLTYDVNHNRCNNTAYKIADEERISGESTTGPTSPQERDIIFSRTDVVIVTVVISLIIVSFVVIVGTGITLWITKGNLAWITSNNRDINTPRTTDVREAPSEGLMNDYSSVEHIYAEAY